MKLFKTSSIDIVKGRPTLLSTCPVSCGPSACKSSKLSLVCICPVNEIVCLICPAVQLPTPECLYVCMYVLFVYVRIYLYVCMRECVCVCMCVYFYRYNGLVK